NVATGDQGVDILDETYIAPGVMTSVYQTAQTHWTGKDIRVILVEDAELLKKKSPKDDPAPVLGFACLHVHKVVAAGDEGDCEYYNGEGPLPGAVPGGGKKCIIVSFSEA